MRGVLRVLLSLALAVVSVSYLKAEKRVTLADGGRVRTMQTFAPNVGSFLDRVGVKLSPGDRISETPQASPRGRIEIKRAKDVVVVLNGSRQVTRVTGETVSEILGELNVASVGALTFPNPSERVDHGEEIVVAQPIQVTVEHDGIAQPVVTNVMTVGGLLRQMRIALGPHDRVEPSIVAYPSSGSVVKVIRVNKAIERVTSSVPFRVQLVNTDKLELGQRQVARQGRPGVMAKIYEITYQDGRVLRRRLTRTETVASPQNEIVHVGTKRPAPPPPPANSQTGKASWYRAAGLTAAHRSLPMGTTVTVTNLANGRSIAVVIRDRGPFVDGRVIDLSDTAFAELAPLSTGVISVKLEW